MTEAAFPLLGAAFVVLVVLPACALVARFLLTWLERDEARGPLHRLHLRYVVLTGSSVLPLAWFLSAGLHQAESGQSELACLIDHEAAGLCFEPGFFVLTLAFVVLVALVRAARSSGDARASSSSAAHALLQRLERVVSARPSLVELTHRLVVTDEEDFALGTQGWLSPRVLVGTTFAARVSDEMLASALAHEREHVLARDPLRYLLLRFALVVNPFGRLLLEPHVARWQAAREAHCDRAAVVAGAAPLALADAIVRAARPAGRPAAVQPAVALGARDTAVPKLRVGLLLAFAERAPARCCAPSPSTFPLALTLLFVTLLLPHQAGTLALDVLHTSAERALTYVSP